MKKNIIVFIVAIILMVSSIVTETKRSEKQQKYEETYITNSIDSANSIKRNVKKLNFYLKDIDFTSSEWKAHIQQITNGLESDVLDYRLGAAVIDDKGLEKYSKTAHLFDAGLSKLEVIQRSLSIGLKSNNLRMLRDVSNEIDIANKKIEQAVKELEKVRYK